MEWFNALEEQQQQIRIVLDDADGGTGAWNGPFPLQADGQPVEGITGD